MEDCNSASPPRLRPQLLPLLQLCERLVKGCCQESESGDVCWNSSREVLERSNSSQQEVLERFNSGSTVSLKSRFGPSKVV